MKTSDLVWQDSQHQQLLTLIEELKTSPENGYRILEKLTIYVEQHFSLEEEYMHLSAYPDTEKHIEMHRKFAEKVYNLKNSKNILEHGFNDDTFRKNITQFLNTWLINHLMGIDKELEAHILKSGIR